MAPPGIGDQKSAIGKKLACPITDYRSLKMMGLGRFELPTSRLSSARSNQLSYKPLGQETVISRRKSATARSATLLADHRLLTPDWARPRRKRNGDGGVPPSGIRGQMAMITRS